MKEWYQANDRFMVRIPTVEETAIQYTKEKVLELCKDEEFREKIKIASPSLLEMMDLYLNDAEKLTKKKQTEFLNSVMKYYIRAKKRTTPFGLFSGVGIGEFAVEEHLDDTQMHFQKKVHVDTEWLYGYLAQLESRYYGQLQFRLNHVCYQNGNRVTLLYSTQKDIAEMSVRFTEVFAIVQSICGEYKKYEEIYQEIQKQYPTVEEDTIKNYLQELIQKQILISNLRPSFTSKNQLKDVKEQCEKAGLIEIAHTMERICELCVAYEETLIGEGIEQYCAIVEAMKEVYQSKYYVQVDTIFDESTIKLSASIQKSVEHLATFFAAMSSISKNSYQHLTQYRNRFIEKYGFQREVPVLELLDSAVGLGAPNGYCCPVNDFGEESLSESELPIKTRNYFVSQYEEALQNHTAIQLDMESMSEILDCPKIQAAPLSFEMYFMIKEKDGKRQLSLGANGGSMCAGKTFGRFATESKDIEETLLELNQKEKELLPENTETCEISFLPSEPRSGNVVRCITGREKYLTAYTHAEAQEKEIRLEDILIGATEKQFYARNAKTGKYIVFGANNMYNIMLQPNVFRFLLEIANDKKTVWCDFPWKYAYLFGRHIPQIEFEGIVLSNEKWYINRMDIGLAAEEKSYEAFQKAWLCYIEEKKIPKEVCLVDNDNRIYLDFTQELAIQILFDEWKKKGEDSILLERTEEGESLVYPKGGARPMEIVVPVFRKEKDIFEKQNTTNIFIDKKEHLVFPYENWLYLKLYCKKDREEELLALNLKAFGAELKQKFQIGHFFMRYMDPKPHIRLRFYGSPDLLLQATPMIIEWTRNLEKNKIIGDMSICTYEKEIERYGGVGLISTAEALFRIDSVIVEEILYRKRCKQLELDEMEIAIASVLMYVCAFYDDFKEQLAYLTKNYHDGSYRKPFQEKRETFLALFDLEHDWEYFQSKEDRKEFLLLLEQRKQWITCYQEEIRQQNPNEDFKNNIVNSVLHLHCNRLLGTDRELERKVMAFAESVLYAKKYQMKQQIVER